MRFNVILDLFVIEMGFSILVRSSLGGWRLDLSLDSDVSVGMQFVSNSIKLVDNVING